MFDMNNVCSWLSPFWLHLNFVHNILLSASEIIINDKTGQQIFGLGYVFECLCRLLYYFLIYPFCSLSVAIIITMLTTMLTTNTNKLLIYRQEMEKHKQQLDREYESLLTQFSKELEKLQLKHQVLSLLS